MSASGYKQTCEPRDWVRFTDRHEWPSVQMPKRHEKHDSGGDAEPDLERVNLSVSAVISAWGIYIVMVVGLLLFSAMYPPQVYDIGAIDLSDAIQHDGGADVPTRGSPVSQPSTDRSRYH